MIASKLECGFVIYEVISFFLFVFLSNLDDDDDGSSNYIVIDGPLIFTRKGLLDGLKSHPSGPKLVDGLQ